VPLAASADFEHAVPGAKRRGSLGFLQVLQTVFRQWVEIGHDHRLSSNLIIADWRDYIRPPVSPPVTVSRVVGRLMRSSPSPPQHHIAIVFRYRLTHCRSRVECQYARITSSPHRRRLLGSTQPEIRKSFPAPPFNVSRPYRRTMRHFPHQTSIRVVTLFAANFVGPRRLTGVFMPGPA